MYLFNGVVKKRKYIYLIKQRKEKGPFEEIP